MGRLKGWGVSLQGEGGKMKYHDINSWRRTIQMGAYGIKERMIADLKGCIEVYSNAKGDTIQSEEKRIERVEMLRILLSEFQPIENQLKLF